MNKWLLVSNVASIIMILILVLGGCTSSNAELTNLANQVQADKATIAQLQATVNQQGQQIQSMQTQFGALQAQMQASLQMVSAQLQQYVQQYVQSYSGK